MKLYFMFQTFFEIGFTNEEVITLSVSYSNLYDSAVRGGRDREVYVMGDSFVGANLLDTLMD